ncbi:protein YkfB, partial [Enterobacter kobei]
TTITVVMDHQQYIIPSSLGWRNGDNAWFDFISNISEAGQFDVYVNDRKAGTFTVDLKNAEKVLPTPGDCSND